jgi:AraC-like DNA-binding protein
MLQRKYTESLVNTQSVYKLYLKRENSTEKLSSMDMVFLESVLKYIEKNMANEHLSIDNLTQELAISRSHLFRKITALTGFPPARLIRNYRLELAMKMFKEHEQITIMEVIHTIGFSDPKYFSRVFKEYFGVAPLMVKNVNKK